MNTIKFRVKKVAKQGGMRVIVVPKSLHGVFFKLGENRGFDISCKPLPEEGEK